MKKDKSTNLKVSRRKFMKVVGASSAGLVLNPTFLPKIVSATPNFTAKVATATLSTYDEAYLKKAVEQSLTNLGGLGDIIKPGDTVGIKINLTGGSEHAENYQNSSGKLAIETYWTHPTLLKVVGQALKDAGAGKLYILEALYDWESVDNFGFNEVVDYLGATFIDLNEKAPYDDYIQKSVGDNDLIYSELTLNGIFNELDCFISMPKAKQHESAGITHGMKNLIGILPVPAEIYNDGKSHRAAIHNFRTYDNNKYNNLCRVIMDINRATPIHLVVNDAVKTVLGSEGPWTSTGVTPANFDTLIFGKDKVAVDSVSTDIIGFDPMAEDYNSPYKKNINYLKLATELGLGEYDLEKIEVLNSVTGVDTEIDNQVPNSIQLHQNYPNPFNPSTSIKFSIPKSGNVKLTVYDSRGREIEILVNQIMNAGTYEVNWNAGNLSAGAYFYMLSAKNFKSTKKMIFTK